MTVYQCIVNYESYSKFKFNAKGRNIIGMMVAREYREQYITTERVELVESIEPDGTFTVYNYPNNFTEVIDNVIHTYVKKCLSKKTNEKPLVKTNPSPLPISYSSDPPAKKERKRRPIQPQPHFSGKLLKKK